MLVFPLLRRHRLGVLRQFLDHFSLPNPCYITSLRISWVHLLQEAMEQAEELEVSANRLRKDREKLQTRELQCHSYPVVPNSGRTSCSKDATILLRFFRGLGPGRRSARSHSVSPRCHK
jgi:hypothetical protein